MRSGRQATEISRRKRRNKKASCETLKVEFRREDQALAKEGRAYEVLKRNVAALGIDLHGERPRLLSINGVRFRQ